MADENTPADTDETDWSRLLIRTLTDLGVQGACPACGQTKWSTGQDPDSTTSDGLTMVAQGTYIPAYIVACKNCGFIRMHARLVIDEAIEAADKKALPDDE